MRSYILNSDTTHLFKGFQIMAAKSTSRNPFARLSAFDSSSGELNVIIETPKRSRNKFSYDEELGLFKLGGVLPSGAVFPFDFGFVPSTLGGDGDPLDVLLLMDEPAFAGCLVHARLVGVIEALQTEREGLTTRNDRLIAIAAKSHTHAHVRSLSHLNEHLLDEIEHFFVSYNTIKGKQFKPLGRFGTEEAVKLVQKSVEDFQRPKTRQGKTKKRAGAKKSMRPVTKKRA
jgi:inorganic pyrophosphatase